MNAFQGHLEHMFDDVAIFSQDSNGIGFCHICQCEHEVPAVDVLVTGPSCKDVSIQNANKSSYANCILVENGRGMAWNLGQIK